MALVAKLYMVLMWMRTADIMFGMELYSDDGCLDACAVTSDYNPVCGTDFVTYINPTRLLCWKKCRDPDLGLAHFTGCIDWILGNHLL
ncbi:protease inhibitor 2-like [Palaemon carinicauda]|uniref:protease inhibitor 2-like n=1 Tax=Palaemon carinicauda TaxID=392227 RepID=UPI0035B58EF1